MSAKNAINQILSMKGVRENHKKEMLGTMIWKITEADGKYKTHFISKETLERRLAGNNSIKGLNHEHVFTKKNLIERLLKNRSNLNLTLKDAIACTVTKDEHKRLNKTKGYEGWDRYRKSGIKVYDTLLKKWKF